MAEMDVKPLTSVVTTSLLDDWTAPTHIEPIADYGMRRKIDDGHTVFGFRCTFCQCSWRRDYNSGKEFNVSVGLLRSWLSGHQHKE